MTKLEFEKVLNDSGIKNKCPNDDNIYLWEDREIKFNNGFAEIKGTIPYDFAETLYSKYPNNLYSTIVNDGDGKAESKPIDFFKVASIDGFSTKTKKGLLFLIFEFEKYILLQKNDLKIKTKKILF